MDYVKRPFRWWAHYRYFRRFYRLYRMDAIKEAIKEERRIREWPNHGR